MSKHFSRTLLAAALAATLSSPQAAELDTTVKQFSYTIGLQYAQQLKKQGLEVDGAAFGAAIDDALQGKEPQLSAEQMRGAIQAVRDELQKQKAVEAAAALEAGRKFLEENKARDGVVTLPSGLQYLVEQEGSGDVPGEEAKVTVHYVGTLINGKEFDSSFRRQKPATFDLQGVIPGFREAISKMKPGAKWTIYVPPELGYGEKGAGSTIGPNETLIFDIELISFEPAAETEAEAEKK